MPHAVVDEPVGFDEAPATRTRSLTVSRSGSPLRAEATGMRNPPSRTAAKRSPSVPAVG
jgi:hypothetical protein